MAMALFSSRRARSPCSEVGLTYEDKTAIADTWNLFQREYRTNAVGLFIALFARYPDYQKLFPRFGDVPVDEMDKNKLVTAHALAVIYFITCIIDSLNDDQVVTELIKKNARNHVQRPVTMEHFLNLEVLLLEVMRDKLRSRMSASVIKSWEKFFVLHNSILSKVHETFRQ